MYIIYCTDINLAQISKRLSAALHIGMAHTTNRPKTRKVTNILQIRQLQFLVRGGYNVRRLENHP